MGLLDILTNALQGGNSSGQHFDQVAQAAPSDVLAHGLQAAFQSDATPAVGEMVGQMFANSNPQQQAGMLNRVLGSLGPGALGSLLGGTLGKVMAPGSTQISAEQASQLSPQQVQEVVQQAHDADPGIVSELAGFYAQHSTLINTLGGAALAIVMAKMKDHVAR